MPIDAGKMEILRDWYNHERVFYYRLTQVQQIMPIPPSMKEYINFFEEIQKTLENWENNND